MQYIRLLLFYSVIFQSIIFHSCKFQSPVNILRSRLYSFWSASTAVSVYFGIRLASVSFPSIDTTALATNIKRTVAADRSLFIQPFTTRKCQKQRNFTGAAIIIAALPFVFRLSPLVRSAWSGIYGRRPRHCNQYGVFFARKRGALASRLDVRKNRRWPKHRATYHQRQDHW